MAWISGDLLKELKEVAEVLKKADEEYSTGTNQHQSAGPLRRAPQDFASQFHRPI